MTVNAFAQKVASLEGLCRQMSIAQIMEVLKVTNRLTNGILYAVIHLF